MTKRHSCLGSLFILLSACGASPADNADTASLADAAADSGGNDSGNADAASDAALPDGAADGGMCVALFGPCSASDACCEGSCGGGVPGYVQCLLRQGDACRVLTPPAALKDDCGPSTVCDPATLKCVFPTCFSRADDPVVKAGSKDSAYCNNAPSVACCDPLMVCDTELTGDAHSVPYTHCCIPNGTAVAGAERNKCCSGSLVNGMDGIERCAAPM